MRRRTKTLSLSEHIMMAAAAQKERDRYLHLYCQMARVYGKTSREARAAEKVQRALDAFRCTMDNAVFREHTDAIPAIYYRGQSHLHYCGTPDCGALIGSGQQGRCESNEDHADGLCGPCRAEADRRDEARTMCDA